MATSSILIVDDDPILLTVLRSFLQKHQYIVITASTAREGLRLLDDHACDLVISDVAMPDMDGMEFCRLLRQHPQGRSVPFIFLSGRSDVEERIRGHEIGGDDYVTKPFEMRELLAKIQRQLSRVFLERQLSEPEGATAKPLPLPLTPAETRVFWEVVQGGTNKQISEHLFISPRTVQTHLSNILSKLNLENRTQLVRYAYEHGHQMPSDLPSFPES